jgi:hypothetical protein
VASLTSVAASAGTPESGLHTDQRFQTGSWCAGARDEAPRKNRVVCGELLTLYEALSWDALFPSSR